MIISEENRKEAEELSTRIYNQHCRCFRSSYDHEDVVKIIADALQARDDAARTEPPAAPCVDVDVLAKEVSFKLLAEVHHDGYFASHDEGSTFISIIKTALLKAQGKA